MQIQWLISYMNAETDEKCNQMIQKYKYINDNISININADVIFEKMKQELDEKEIETTYNNDNIGTINSEDFINQMMFNASQAFENKLKDAKVYDGSNVTSTISYNSFRRKSKINFDKYDNYEHVAPPPSNNNVAPPPSNKIIVNKYEYKNNNNNNNGQPPILNNI